MVPLLDLQEQYRPLRDDILAAITRVCDSQRFIGGPRGRGARRELGRARSASRTRSACRPGTDALLVALMALGDRARATKSSRRRSRFSRPPARRRGVGATPLLVDIDPATYNLDPTRGGARPITARTTAIIPVHLYGQCADMDPLLDAARGTRHRRDRRRGAGDWRELQGAAGRVDGRVGLLFVLPEQESRRVRRRRAADHQRRRRWRTKCGCCATTAPSRSIFTRASAAISGSTPSRPRSCASSCRIWRAWTRCARRNAARYDALFARGSPRARSDHPSRAAAELCPHLQPIRHPRARARSRARAPRRRAGIGTEIYYPVPFHLQECFAPLGYRPGDFPAAEAAAAETLALPIYGELTAAQQRDVVAAAIAGALLH